MDNKFKKCATEAYEKISRQTIKMIPKEETFVLQKEEFVPQKEVLVSQK